jgi:hypothetical protein
MASFSKSPREELSVSMMTTDDTLSRKSNCLLHKKKIYIYKKNNKIKDKHVGNQSMFNTIGRKEIRDTQRPKTIHINGSYLEHNGQI